MRKLVLGVALLLGGCANLGGTFDQAALAECRTQLNSDDRRACLSQTSDDAYARRQASIAISK